MFSIDTSSLTWEKLRDGVYIKHLKKDDVGEMRLDIMKIKPHATLEAHKHITDEWTYVLEGVFKDEFGTYPVGYFKTNEKGSQHTSGSDDGCVILVYWCGRHDFVE